jgi:uncharacterized protein YuzE
MKISYDPEVDAAYISFETRRVSVTTVRLSEDVAVDFGPGEEVVGIEILDASRHMRLGKKNPKIWLKNLQPA